MAATTTFDAVTNVGTRFHIQRINRRLDDRDNVIKEAIGILEEKDPTYFPTVTLVRPVSISAAALQGAASSTVTLCTIEGVNLSATASDWEVMVGGVTGGVTGEAVDAGTITCNANITTVAQDDLVLVQIWISETLATEFFLTVDAA